MTQKKETKNGPKTKERSRWKNRKKNTKMHAKLAKLASLERQNNDKKESRSLKHELKKNETPKIQKENKKETCINTQCPSIQ